MSHCFFDGNQVCSGFIKVQPESMAETVEIKTAVTKPIFFKVLDKNIIDGLLTDMRSAFLSREQPVFLAGTPVRSTNIGNQKVISPI